MKVQGTRMVRIEFEEFNYNVNCEGQRDAQKERQNCFSRYRLPAQQLPELQAGIPSVVEKAEGPSMIEEGSQPSNGQAVSSGKTYPEPVPLWLYRCLEAFAFQ